MTVAMENIKEWENKDDSGSLTLSVNYSNFLQLTFTLCDSIVTLLFACEPQSNTFQKGVTLSSMNKPLSKQVIILSTGAFLTNPGYKSQTQKCYSHLFAERLNPLLCLPGIDERSGSSPWGPGEENSPSFTQGRVCYFWTNTLNSNMQWSLLTLYPFILSNI